MSSNPPLDSDVLVRILLLQSTLQAAPDERRLMEMVAHGLATLPGAAGCVVCVEGVTTRVTSADRPPVFEGCAGASTLGDEPFAGCAESCSCKHGKNLQTVRLQTPHRVYGSIFLQVNDAAQFEAYLPFAANTANLVALQLENNRGLSALEQSVRQVTGFSESLLDSMQDGLSILDPDGVQVQTNPSFRQMTGFSTQELIGVGPPHPYWPPEKLDEITRSFEETHGGEFNTLETIFMRKNGERFPVLVSPSWLKNEQGDVTHYFATIKDLSKGKQAAEALTESESRLREAQQAGAIGSFEGEFGKDEEWWSDELFHLFGLDPTRFKPTRDSFLALLHPSEHGEYVAAISRARETGERFQTVYRIRHSTGEWHHFETIATVTRDASGAVLGLRGTVRDITVRTRAENALLRSESRYRTLVEHAPVGIHEIDLDGRITSMNAVGVEMMGATHESDVCGLADLDAVHDRDRSTVSGLLDKAMAGQSSTFEFIAATDGPAQYFSSCLVPIRSARGDVDRLVGITTDITKRKRSEEALRESNVRFTQISEHIEEVFWLGTSSGPNGFRILYVNPAFERLWLRTAEELYQDSFVWYECIHAEDSERVLAAFDRFLRGDGDYDLAFRILRPDGSERTVASRAYLIRNEAGQVTRAAGLTRDITELKKEEDKRKLLEVQLHESQKMQAIGLLAGGVAHDFNNHLTAILLSNELLQSTVATMGKEVIRELEPGLEDVKAVAIQAAAVTRQLLTFSRRDVTRPEVLNPKKIVADMERMLRRLIGEHIDLCVRLGPGTCMVFADSGQVEQVILNLAINAADAMPEGGRLEIGVCEVELGEAEAVMPAAQPGRHVAFSVADNGVGMSKDTVERIFEPFFTTKPIGKGTGLGLATVYGAVQRLGGHLRVVSECGIGSTLTAYVPVVDEQETVKIPDSQVHRSGAGETILVCEDDDNVRRVLCRPLEAAGYRIVEATNGRHALELAAQHDGAIDLLLSDVLMPEVNGRELADRLTRERAGLKVLFVSGYSADHLDQRGIQCGDVELLSKPFGPDTLLRRVREVLDVERGTR